MEAPQFSYVGPLLVAVGLVLFGLTVVAAIVSVKEGERRAASRMLLMGLLLLVPYVAAGFIRFPGQEIAAILLLALPLLAVLAFLVPLGQRSIAEDDTPRHQIDERDIMFARYHLVPGTERFDEYYRRNPEKRAPDDRFRSKPGLLGKGAAYFEPCQFAAAQASFDAVAAFHGILDHEPSSEKVYADPAKMSRFVKMWAHKLGAVSVGITGLRDYHLYSHIGRNEPYGQPIDLKHKYAIAVTVEMEKEAIDHAPYGPTVMESAQQYLAAGAIAVQIAEFIRKLGYPARAHIDGNYRIVCPLVARDAGLGEIGRMGLLMTPGLGPRVRLSVVTTDLPLVTDTRTRDYSVIDFCRQCTKCAVVCPSKAIPSGDRCEIDGVRRWQIDSEACFTFWCSSGTDCARCVRVCPYSHPDNLFHNIIRFGVRNSALFRVFARKMDDLVYGRKPLPVAVPEWMRMGRPSTVSIAQGSSDKKRIL